MIFLGRLSDTPVAQVALAQTPGLPGIYVLSGPVSVVERPRVQVTSRDTVYDTAFNRSKLVESLLESLDTRRINGTLYHGAHAVQPPFLLRYDENNRPVICQNFEVTKAASAAQFKPSGADGVTPRLAESETVV